MTTATAKQTRDEKPSQAQRTPTAKEILHARWEDKKTGRNRRNLAQRGAPIATHHQAAKVRPNGYFPHQGERECERRVRQQARAAFARATGE